MTISVKEPCPKFLAEVAVLETMGLVRVETEFKPITHWVVYDHSYEILICSYCHEQKCPNLYDEAAAEALRNLVLGRCTV